MVKKSLKILIVLVLLCFIIYILFPAPKFPTPPPDSIQSTEPADTESIYRRAYYSNLSRSQIMDHYKDQFNFIIQYRINHPPEEAFAQIRDQTRSSWLEQLVHPGRESLYINGFYPTTPADQLSVKGVPMLAKITIHYFPSHPVSRLTTLTLSLICLYFLVKEYRHV